MATGLLAKKLGMTQIFTHEGDCVPVTVIEAGPCTVVRRKTAEKDGYDAVVLGWETVELIDGVKIVGAGTLNDLALDAGATICF